ncbi:hypothetical protein OE88DRAFT_1662598 [Heliocybe sulcata]|uniref:Uncharacterized protein n=1 Tax=Heliocybe sulcata TaxID=5364 RepID=A0A5C3MZG8_9AGAM|nr:hypothetical protein OE88DRAFT_1662598 [Heliocybe sulcata]
MDRLYLIRSAERLPPLMCRYLISSDRNCPRPVSTLQQRTSSRPHISNSRLVSLLVRPVYDSIH